jgi:predicted secreted protein with PEFG-CTERM motif
LNYRFEGFTLFVILVCATGAAPVFAQSADNNPLTANPQYGSQSFPAVTVATDKLSYGDGDKIVIFGTTQNTIIGTPVTVKIISPMGNIVEIDQVNLGSDSTYSTTITATGTLWQAAGTYQVMVQYSTKDRTAQTTFQFSGSSGAAVGNTIPVDGTNFTIKYSITNGKVTGIRADPQDKSLVISLQTSGNGVLSITLPRGLIDSTMNGTDTKFIVMAGGQDIPFQDVSATSDDRTLSIPFTNGTTQITIFGTFVIPEFGPIVGVILMISLIGTMLITRKSANITSIS